MAEASIRKQSKIELRLLLSEKEARFLMGIVQNPIGCDPEGEPDHERNLREAIFNALKDNINAH